ncbi:MAG TPA: TIR domain-containing protein [Ignavibacteria bacterium]
MARTKRQIFFSFDYEPDVFRVSQVRNMGVVEDKPLLSSNEWEEIRKGKDEAIKKWIDDNMKYRSCIVVLVGRNTANKRWVKYEIERAWRDNKGLIGIYIHNLECPINGYGIQGTNPFNQYTINDGKINLADIIECYDPPSFSIESLYDSTLTKGKIVYRNIKDNIEELVEKAIKLREKY